MMRAAMPAIKAAAAKPPLPRKRMYNEGATLDQGATPHCVGFSARGFLNAAPLMTTGKGPSALELYRAAQRLDEWPGENYDGSSVRGGMKALQAAGQISSYVWGQSIDEAIAWMNGGYGTVIIGTDWFEIFDNIGSDGMMRMPAALDTPIGGHAYRLNWFDPKKKAFLVINSWGVEAWGIKGRAWMTPEVLAFLLRRDGEIAAPTQVLVKPAAIVG